MKKRYLILLVSVLSVFNACNDWLDVSPRSEIRESELFLSEDGFKHALTGAYILIAQQQLYGKNASMYIPEALSRHWTLPSDQASELYRLSNYEYTTSNVESLINNLWLNYYKVIAQLNNILENIENSDVKFSYNNDKLIKGEALGLRAFLHLEVLRLFGPIPDIAQSEDIAIPYVTELTRDPNKLISISYAKVLSSIEADLNAAEELLLESDPLLHNSNLLLNRTSPYGDNYPKDSWQLFRQSRFNYYALLGAKARFYHWTGKKSQAVEYAQKVIEAINDDDTPKFQLADEAYYSGSDRNMVMYCEHLFGVQNSDLQSIINNLFKVAGAQFSQTAGNLNIAYETSVNPNDIRRPSRYWVQKSTSGTQLTNHFLKYSGSDDVPTNNRVPLLRLAEMYLIVIEDLPLEEAKPYFSDFRIARALDISIEETSLLDEAARLSRLEKEYRKEFYGEGQMFFFYKKHNYESFTWTTAFTVPADGYVIPKPKNQLKFE